MAATGVTADTLTTMNGLVKEVYAKQIQNAVPDVAILLKEFPFSPSATVGNLYHQPVVLQNEVGFTYDAGNDTQAIGYNPALPMQMKDAQVAPTQLLLKSIIGYEVIHRAQQAGDKAFEAATMLLVKNMVDSMALRVEMAMLYGGSGLGTFASAGSVTGSGNTTQVTLTVTSAQWAVGLWQGQETSYLDFYNGASIVNTNLSTVQFAPQLLTVNPAAKTVTVIGNNSDINAIATAVGSNPNVITAFWGGAKGNEMVGLKTILSNTGALFNIDASVYDLWRGNTVTLSGVSLTQAILQQAVAVAAGRGLMKEELLLICSTEGWADLLSSQAALRMYDSSYSSTKMENGADELVFNSQNGRIRVVAHPMCKDGDAFLLPTKQIIRVGACEPTFEVPGFAARLPFVPMENQAALQIVRYSSQQIFLKAPARAVYITGIVNTSSAA